MTAPNGHAPLHDADLERLYVAALIAEPARHGLVEVTLTDFVDPLAHHAFKAFANVRARDSAVTAAKVRAELARTGIEAAVSGHRADPTRGWFDELVALPIPADSPVAGWGLQILDFAARRFAAASAEDEAARAEDEVTEFALRDAEPETAQAAAPKPRERWFRGPELAEEILRRAAEPWIPLTLGDEELVRVRAGGIVVIMGGSGSRKSSLTAGLLVEHALNRGPAIALSIELPAEEFGGRIVGMRCDASWEEALRGLVRREFMEDALNLPRLYVLDQDNATLPCLERCIEQARLDYPGEPVLVAIDYAQLLDSAERETRQRVADVFKQINRVARRHRVVAIAVSQMSRAAAAQARDGEKIGAASADGGAESAAIERWASITLSIGAMSEPRDDGSQRVELSLGKARMLGGDRVFLMDSWGRTGRWRVAEAPKPAAEIREGRDTARALKYQQSLEHALLGAAAKSPTPLVREDLTEMIQGRAKTKRAALACLIARGDLAEVALKKLRSRSWLVWTPERAVEAGLKLVRETEDNS